MLCCAAMLCLVPCTCVCACACDEWCGGVAADTQSYRVPTDRPPTGPAAPPRRRPGPDNGGGDRCQGRAAPSLPPRPAARVADDTIASRSGAPTDTPPRALSDRFGAVFAVAREARWSGCAAEVQKWGRGCTEGERICHWTDVQRGCAPPRVTGRLYPEHRRWPGWEKYGGRGE